MLLSKGIITQDLVNMLLSWRHSGFNVFCGPRIHPREEEAMENLARYIIRASFSQERMSYVPEESKVIYQSKDGKEERAFDTLEWLAAMCSHIPNKGESRISAGFVIMAITVMSPVEDGTRKTRMNWAGHVGMPFYPFFLKESSMRWIEYDPIFDKMFQEMAAMVDREAQAKKLGQIAHYVNNKAYTLNVYSPITLYAVNKEVNSTPQMSLFLRLKETSVTDSHWSVRTEKK